MQFGEARKQNREAQLRAAARRRELYVAKAPCGTPRVFLTKVQAGFGWEVRRFGALVLARSETVFSTAALAEAAGAQALQTMKV